MAAPAMDVPSAMPELKPFTIPAFTVPGKRVINLNPLQDNDDDDPAPPLVDSSDDEEMDKLSKRFSLLEVVERSHEVNNFTLRAPVKVMEFVDTDGFKGSYLLPDYDQVYSLIPKETVERDLSRVRSVFDIMATNARFTKQLKEFLAGLWTSMPFSSTSLLTSPLIALFVGDLSNKSSGGKPVPTYDGTYSQLETLTLLAVIVEQIVSMSADMLPPSRKVKEGSSNEQLLALCKEYVEDVQRSFKFHSTELNKWFEIQIVELKKSFPELENSFWSGITTRMNVSEKQEEEEDWSEAVPIKKISNNDQAAGPDTMSWNMIKTQVVPKFRMIVDQFTVAYFNLCEAKILNCLGWITTYPDHVAKQHKYTQVWPNMVYTGTDKYMSDITVNWRRFFTRPVHATPNPSQILYWNEQLDNSKKSMSPEHVNKLKMLLLDNSSLERLWNFASVVPARATLAGHLSFLKHIISKNRCKEIDSAQTWAGLLKNETMEEEFVKAIQTFDIDKAEEESYRTICAELQIFIHPLMYKTE